MNGRGNYCNAKIIGLFGDAKKQDMSAAQTSSRFGLIETTFEEVSNDELQEGYSK